MNDLDAEAALTALDSQDWNGRVVKVRYKERKRFSSWSSSSMESQYLPTIPSGLVPPMYYAPMGYSMAPPMDTSGASLAPISPASPESNYAVLQQQQQQMQYGSGPMEYPPPPSSMSIGQQRSSDFVSVPYPTSMYAPMYDSAGNLLMVMSPQAYASSSSV